MTLTECQQAIAEISSEKMREINRKHGSAHGANLSKLRALAKKIKSNHELAMELWNTGDADARLLALLIIKPRLLTPADLDRMVHELRYAKTADWFHQHVMKKSKHAGEMRLPWLGSPDDFVASAGWRLTNDCVVKSPAGLDLSALLDEIERDMKTTTERKQWSMNACLAEIGIRSPEHRKRALEIGHRLEVLKDYPTSPGCTSPFAPLWIAEMVRRQESSG